MKKYSLLRKFAVTFFAAVVVSSALVGTAAQDNPQPESVRSVQKALPPYNIIIKDGFLSTMPLSERLDMRALFPSENTYRSYVEATLSNLIDVLRALHTNANIVMEPGLANVKISDLQIRLGNGAENLQLNEELSALRVASGNKFLWTQPAESIDPLTGQPSNLSSLYILTADATAPLAKTRKQVEVFNVSDYVQRFDNRREVENSLTKIEGIINETLRIQNFDPESRPESVRLKYHPGANLLIAIGQPDSVDVARKVINALLGQAKDDFRTRNVQVLGAVSKPGPVALPEDGKITILNAISLAGGPTKLANEKKIEFTHKGKTEVLSFDQLKKINNQNEIIYLEPGDIIKVPEIFF